MRRALKVAEKAAGSDKRGHLLDLICTDFLGNRMEEAGVKINEALKSIERVYGVECIAIKTDDDETVVFGAKAAKKYGVT